MKILIADDNQDSADALGELMRIEGHEVHVAYNGRDALRECLNFKPDVAVLDIAMPNMTGFEVAAIVRSKGLVDMRLIALTAYKLKAVEAKAAAGGFDVFLTKPTSVRVIKLAIERGLLSRVSGMVPVTREDDK